MQHELVPAIPSPTPGAELTAAAWRLITHAFMTASVVFVLTGFLGGWFLLGVRLSS